MVVADVMLTLSMVPAATAVVQPVSVVSWLFEAVAIVGGAPPTMLESVG